MKQEQTNLKIDKQLSRNKNIVINLKCLVDSLHHTSYTSSVT